MRSVAAFLGLVFLLLGCPSKDVPTTPAVDASVAVEDAGFDAGIIDAGPPALAVLTPTVTATFVDGGTATVTASAEFEPTSSLTVTLPMPLKDFRIRLFDFRDQLVASDDELAADGLTYRIAPTEPLKTGRAYRLVLDAELGPVVTDPSGRTFDDWELTFRIAGDVQPEPGASKKPAKKRPAGKK